MVRYKRYKRRYKNTTNLITMKFQSFMDIHTKAGEMQIISISAGGKEILNRLPAQFSAYKYYKIGNISVKLVPASTLPVDPTGLSITAGDQLVDPRDQLTPGMMRITNGEDIFEDITGMTADEQHALYNAMMLDPRWFKWMLQAGVKRHATPRYWQIGQLHQDKWPGSNWNLPIITGFGTDDQAVVGTESRMNYGNNPNGSNISGVNTPGSTQYGFFQTGHKGVLGWLPTDGMQFGQSFMAAPPEIEVMKIILPPAYKTEYWYRAYISETVYFREPITNAAGIDGYAGLDIFHRMLPPQVLSPADSTGYNFTDRDTGGNYGDD